MRVLQVDHGEQQGEVAPFVIVGEVVTCADMGDGYGVVARPEMGIECEAAGDGFAGLHVCLRLPQVLGVGAVHRLPQTVFDEVAKHQGFDGLVNLDAYLQADALADFSHLDGFALCVEQGNALQRGFAAARHRLDASVGGDVLLNGLPVRSASKAL